MTSVRPPRARRAIGALLLAVVGGLAVFAGLASSAGAAPASAAAATGSVPACADLTVSEQARQAMAVLTGTVESMVRQPAATGSDVDFVHTVSVDRVYKPSGSLIQTEQVDVTTRRLAAACSLGPLEVGGRYVFFLGIADGDLVATGEGGTAPASTARVEAVEALLGGGRPAVAPQPAEATLTPVVVSAPTPFTRVAMPGAVIALVGLVGLVVVRRFSGRS